MTTLDKLNTLLERFNDLPKQGSQEWIHSKCHTIGGSEISCINGTNAYQNSDELLKRKIRDGKMKVDMEMSNMLDNVNIPDNLMLRILEDDELCLIEYHPPSTENIPEVSVEATEWGKLFEQTSIIYYEQTENVKIYEFGSITSEKYPYNSYSPDGIFIKDDTLFLLEIKNPFRRIPNGFIKADYESQMKAGLSMVPELEGAIFLDMFIRCCSMVQMNMSNDFNDQYPSLYRKLPNKFKTEFYGYILVEYSEESANFFEHFDEESIDNYSHETMGNNILIDIGCPENNLMKEYLECRHKRNYTEYYSISYLKDVNIRSEIKNHIEILELSGIIGIIPFKCMRAEKIELFTFENMLDELQPKVRDFIMKVYIEVTKYRFHGQKVSKDDLYKYIKASNKYLPDDFIQDVIELIT